MSTTKKDTSNLVTFTWENSQNPIRSVFSWTTKAYSLLCLHTPALLQCTIDIYQSIVSPPQLEQNAAARILSIQVKFLIDFNLILSITFKAQHGLAPSYITGLGLRSGPWGFGNPCQMGLDQSEHYLFLNHCSLTGFKARVGNPKNLARDTIKICIVTYIFFF